MIRFHSAGLQTLNLKAGEVVRPRKVVEQRQPSRPQAVRPVRFRMPGVSGAVPERERPLENVPRRTYRAVLASRETGGKE